MHFLSLLPFVSRDRYNKVVALNELARKQLKSWMEEESNRSKRSTLLVLHNAMLRDMLVEKQFINETSTLVETVQSMIGDMQSIVEEQTQPELENVSYGVAQGFV